MNTLTIEHINVRHINPESRELLTSALKWVRRIEERAETLPPAFMDNIDITPLRRRIEAHLEGRISDESAAEVSKVLTQQAI